MQLETVKKLKLAMEEEISKTMSEFTRKTGIQITDLGFSETSSAYTEPNKEPVVLRTYIARAFVTI